MGAYPWPLGGLGRRMLLSLLLLWLQGLCQRGPLLSPHSLWQGLEGRVAVLWAVAAVVVAVVAAARTPALFPLWVDGSNPVEGGV